MGGKKRPNRMIRDYGKVSKTGVVLVKKQNPALSASQWKRRALGLYGTLLVFSEVGPDDHVKENDQVTEELELPRCAKVVVHSVLGMACVCVETSKHPLVFRPFDERHGHLLQEWSDSIRKAVTPPTPGTLEPLLELRALMKRKDLTAAETRRARILMCTPGKELAPDPLLPCISPSVLDCTSIQRESIPSLTQNANGPDQGTCESAPKSWGDGESLFGDPVRSHDIAVQGNSVESDDPFEKISADLISAIDMGVDGTKSRSGPLKHGSNDDVKVLINPHPTYSRETHCELRMGIEVLSAVYDSECTYFGYIASNGACFDVDGVCVGYLNDCERTAGSSQGEYLGCITEPLFGEATIETSYGTPLAKLDLSRAKLRTLAGSTVAEFRISGDVVADLGHAICCFDSLSLHDQPTMALYLSFIAPELLQTAVHKARRRYPVRYAQAAYPVIVRVENAGNRCTMSDVFGVDHIPLPGDKDADHCIFAGPLSACERSIPLR